MSSDEAVQLIFKMSGPAPQFLGTCFAIYDSQQLCTAAHVIYGHELKDLAILGPGEPGRRRILRAIFHPDADIALVHASEPKADLTAFFRSIIPGGTDSAQVIAVGAIEGREIYPPLKTFVGYRMRTFEHVSHYRHLTSNLPLRYWADEINVSVRSGLSGGPAFVETGQLFAMVTESLELGTETSYQTREISEGHTHTTQIVRIVESGIILRLFEMISWIRDIGNRVRQDGG